MFRRSFTLLELIFVIVILGIIGSLGGELLMSVYKNYVMQRAVSNLQLQTSTTMEFIRKNIDNAIYESFVYDDTDNNNAEFNEIKNKNRDNPATTRYRALQWIGKDTESLRGIWNGSMIYPGYSSFIDVVNSGDVNMTTSDCNLSYVEQIQEAIVNDPNNDWILSTSTAAATHYRSALYFTYANGDGNVSARFWVPPLGSIPPDDHPNSLFPIKDVDSDRGEIELSDRPDEIGEQYYLSYSAYALVFERDDNIGEGNISLVWNFRPWNGETYINAINNGNSYLVTNNVKEFDFWSESGGNVIRLYLEIEVDVPPLTEKVRYFKESAIIR